MKLNRCIAISLIGLIGTILSCRSNNNSEFGNIPGELADSLRLIGKKIQQIEIDPSKDNILKGNDGTLLYINANALLDENGNPASGKIVVELKENYSISDFIISNLQTVHNSDILQTQGMIYFSATTSNGATLKIDNKKPIRIEFPVKEKVASAQIFTGKRDEKGNMNWNEMKETSKYLIPVPIRYISHRQDAQFQMGNDEAGCPDYYGITNDIQKNPHYIFIGDIDKFENTLLATREFKQRYDSVCWRDIMNLYVNNLDKNLWEIDELAIKKLTQDSIDAGVETNWGEDYKQNQEAVNFMRQQYGRLINTFRTFARQKLTNIDPLKRVSDTTILETNKAFVAYDALDFGWVNVDYFYRDPKAEKLKLIARTNVPAPKINLIIPERNIILSGISKGNNEYWFSKNEDGYNKLPKGEKAIMVAINIIDNALHFASKEIIIGQHETETLELKKSNAMEIKSMLSEINNSH